MVNNISGDNVKVTARRQGSSSNSFVRNMTCNSSLFAGHRSPSSIAVGSCLCLNSKENSIFASSLPQQRVSVGAAHAQDSSLMN